jgi:hypothetical protein
MAEPVGGHLMATALDLTHKVWQTLGDPPQDEERGLEVPGWEVPGSRFQVPGSRFRVQSSGFRVRGEGPPVVIPRSEATRNLLVYVVHSRSPSQLRIPHPADAGFGMTREGGMGFGVRGWEVEGFWVPGSRFPVQGFRGSGFRVPGSRFSGQGD